jgi:hypothetical protein
MSSFDQLTRRSFLGKAIKFGTAGLAVSCADISPAADTAKSVTGGPWQIGCYTRPWDKYDYRTALDAIAEAGFKYAGLMTTKSESHLIISVSTTPEEAKQVGCTVAIWRRNPCE